jgi:phage terminase large subunit-like protein
MMKTISLPSRIDPSDRATQYAVDVLKGRIVAGPHVRNACRRHIDDLKNGKKRGIHWDLAAAIHVWRWFEQIIKLSEGQFEGKPLVLHPSQAFILGSLFGWKRADGTRRFRRSYIEQGKGNGKSPIAGGIGLFGMTADDESGAEIYAAGSKKEQAGILFRDAVKMVKKSPALAKRLQFSGGEGREHNIAHVSSGSFFRAISRQAGTTGSGPRPHFALCDEVHEHPDRGVMELLERGFKFRRNPLLFMITNSGHDRNSICWEEHEHAIRVSAGTMTPDDDFTYIGEPVDDTTFAYVCALDNDDDPLEDESCWEKANPLLGITITHEYLRGVVAQGKAMPGKLNNILRLHFCQWTDADEAWITREALEAVLDDFEPEDIEGPAYAGVDLSGSRDLTAEAFVVEEGSRDGKPIYAAWVEGWTPEETVRERARADRAPYDVWVNEGFLRTTPGSFVKMQFPAAHLADVHSQRGIKMVAYDRYAYRKFEDELADYGCEVLQVEHPQGGKKRGKLPEELAKEAELDRVEKPSGLWMPGSLATLEELILDKRIRIRRSPPFVSAAMSAATEEDPYGNRWLSKRNATQRIDLLIALAMAVGAATMLSQMDAPVSKGFLEV